MKTFTALQLVSWTMAQPAEKEVSMETGMFYHPCGCLMTQFFRSQGIEKGWIVNLNGDLLEEYRKGGKVIATVDLPVSNVFSFLRGMRGGDDNLETFGGIQKCLRQNQKELVDKAAE